jgi:hypothetical protein
MSLSTILDVAIGMVLIYYVLSLIVSYITSAIAKWTEMRAKNLEQVLRGRLRDPDTFDKFMNHPLVKNLQPMQSNWQGKVSEGKVTDIPAHAFVSTLFDILAPETPDQDKLEQLRQAVTGMPEGEIKRSLVPLVGTTVTDIQTARQNVENWYNDIMQNVSNLYKQHARRIAIICALVVSIAVDADSLTIVKQLWDQPTLRAAATAKAEAYVKQAPDPNQANVASYVSELEELKIPILWTMPFPTTWQGWALKAFGWAITWLAIAQGSSFWYDVLRKIRTGGQPTTASPAKA